ncbi:hypothetical protein AB6G58_20540 [Providencia huaxiensis]
MLLCELKLELLMSANHPLAKVNNLKPADLKARLSQCLHGHSIRNCLILFSLD